jgi:hypothetical protein
MGVDRCAALLIKSVDHIRLGISSLHAWRTNRHSRNRKAGNRGPLLEHALDEIRGHMSFDNVPIDYRRVTGGKLVGNTVFDFDVAQLISPRSDCLCFNAIFLQVPDPGSATPSRGILVDDSNVFVGLQLRIYCRRAAQSEQQKKSDPKSRDSFR